MGYLKNKRGIVMGVANDHSIAWGIAQKLSDEGADLCFTYQGDSLLRRVKPLAESINNDFLIECDVLEKESIESTFSRSREQMSMPIGRSKADATPDSLLFTIAEKLMFDFNKNWESSWVRGPAIHLFSSQIDTDSFIW